MTKESISIEQCEMWRNKPTVNPLTGRTIKMNGETYNELLRDCAKVIQDHVENGKILSHDKNKGKEEKRSAKSL